jgi:hypothetical protein
MRQRYTNTAAKQFGTKLITGNTTHSFHSNTKNKRTGMEHGSSGNMDTTASTGLPAYYVRTFLSGSVDGNRNDSAASDSTYKKIRSQFGLLSAVGLLSYAIRQSVCPNQRVQAGDAV